MLGGFWITAPLDGVSFVDIIVVVVYGVTDKSRGVSRPCQRVKHSNNKIKSFKLCNCLEVCSNAIYAHESLKSLMGYIGVSGNGIARENARQGCVCTPGA